MTATPWIHRSAISMLLLAAVASPICSAGESGTAQTSKPSSTAPQGCAVASLTDPGCGEPGGGEDIDGLGCDYKVLDLNALFDSVAGDKPIFPCLKDQKVGDLKYSAGGELRYR